MINLRSAIIHRRYKMKKSGKDIWRGLQAAAVAALSARDYRAPALAKRLAGGGVEAGQIVSANRRSLAAVWIPGVEIFARTIHVQRQRGLFGEFARRDEGVLGSLKFWPKQWATARMFANTAKGFHVHPPFIPEGEDPAKWLRRQFSGDERCIQLRGGTVGRDVFRAGPGGDDFARCTRRFSQPHHAFFY